MKDKLLRMVVKYFNLKGFATDLVLVVMKDSLKKVVEDSSNTIDDSLFPLIWPLAEKEAVDFIEEKLDLEKMLGLDTPVA